MRHKRRGKSNREIAIEMRVSVSTVKRVWSYWLTHRECLPIRKRGRKMKELSEKEKVIISETKMKYKLGARRLEKVIEQVYGIYIPHNRIHKYLLEEGLAKEEPRKKRRRKPYIRYEREHSMSAAHIDIQVGSKYIGLQIKPTTYEQTPEIYRWKEWLSKTHDKFEKDKAGKVFIVFSIKREGKKVIYNPEVIDEITPSSTHQ